MIRFFEKLRLSFFAATIFGIFLSLVTIVVKVYSSVIELPILSWIYSIDVFTFVYPALCSVPFCWLLFYERKNNYQFFIRTRINIKKYYRMYWLTGALLALVCIFTISFSGAVISLIIKPIHQTTDIRDLSSQFLLGSIMETAPLLYAFIISPWRGFIGILLFSLSYILSKHSRNLFIALTGPFIYSILENFVTAVFGVPNFSLLSSFNPERLNWDYFSVSPCISVLVGPIVLIVVCLVLSIYFRYKERKENAVH